MKQWIQNRVCERTRLSRLILPSSDSSVTRGRDPARRPICSNAENSIRDDGMVHLGNVRHGSPRPIEIKEPHIVVICGPVIVDVEITDIGVEVVGGSRDILVRLGSIPNRAS